MADKTNKNNMDRLMDVEMDVSVRFGLTEVPLHEVVNFGGGSMIELNRTVDEPVELLVNNFPFAKGEVVVVDGYYSVRITEVDLSMNSDGDLVSNTNEESPQKSSPGSNVQSTQKPAEKPKQPQAAPPPQKPAQKPNPDTGAK